MSVDSDSALTGSAAGTPLYWPIQNSPGNSHPMQQLLLGFGNELLLIAALAAALLAALWALKGVQTLAASRADYCRHLTRLARLVGALELVRSRVCSIRPRTCSRGLHPSYPSFIFITHTHPFNQLASFVLSSRANATSAATSLADPLSLTAGRWCIARAAASVCAGLCLLVAHSHHVLRWTVRVARLVSCLTLFARAQLVSVSTPLSVQALVLQPCVAAADLISEIYFVSALNCMRRGRCVYNAVDDAWGSAFAMRDLIGAAINVRAFHCHVGTLPSRIARHSPGLVFLSVLFVPNVVWWLVLVLSSSLPPCRYLAPFSPPACSRTLAPPQRSRCPLSKSANSRNRSLVAEAVAHDSQSCISTVSYNYEFLNLCSAAPHCASRYLCGSTIARDICNAESPCPHADLPLPTAIADSPVFTESQHLSNQP